MSLTESDFTFLERHWKKFPFGALAAKYQMSEIELLQQLRKKGIITEIQPVELQYIRDSIGMMPPEAIMRDLGVTQAQFSQICQKVLRVKQSKSLAELTLGEVTKKVKWLLETRLQMTIDDRNF